MSKPEKRYVLLVDDDVCLTAIVKRAFAKQMPEATLLTARTVAEAQTMLAQNPISFFILDLNLPDGTGIDLLCDIRTISPDARVVVITSTALPAYRERSKQLGVLMFREKPIDPKELIEVVRADFAGKEDTEFRAKQGQYAVSLTCLSALDVIQLKCLTGATLALQFVSPQGQGMVFFEIGEITHAEVEQLTGEPALERILRWRGGKITELRDARPRRKTITTSWQGLLLNVAQRIDETREAVPH